MVRNWAVLRGENSQWKGFWRKWQANKYFWRSRGRGFALKVWLLGKLCQGAPSASRRKKAVPRQNDPGGKHPDLEFTL